MSATNKQHLKVQQRCDVIMNQEQNIVVGVSHQRLYKEDLLLLLLIDIQLVLLP